MALISIIVPVYQVEKYISRCIESLIGQTSQDFKVIFVDDGSTDSSALICQKFCEEHENFSLVQKENGGLSSARNYGLSQVITPYVMFLDSDDWLDKETISYLRSNIEKYSSDIITYKNIQTKTENLIANSLLTVSREITGEEAFISMISEGEVTSFSTDKLYKVDLFKKNNIYFPEGYYYEDLGTVYKLLLSANSVLWTDKVLYYYYVANPSAITAIFSEKKLSHLFKFYNDILLYGTQKFVEDKVRQKLRFYYLNACVYIYFKLIEFNFVDLKLYKDVGDILDREKISFWDLRSYSNFKLYILYRLKLFRIIIAMKSFMDDFKGDKISENKY